MGVVRQRQRDNIDGATGIKMFFIMILFFSPRHKMKPKLYKNDKSHSPSARKSTNHGKLKDATLLPTSWLADLNKPLTHHSTKVQSKRSLTILPSPIRADSRMSPHKLANIETKVSRWILENIPENCEKTKSDTSMLVQLTSSSERSADLPPVNSCDELLTGHLSARPKFTSPGCRLSWPGSAASCARLVVPETGTSSPVITFRHMSPKLPKHHSDSRTPPTPFQDLSSLLDQENTARWPWLTPKQVLVPMTEPQRKRSFLSVDPQTPPLRTPPIKRSMRLHPLSVPPGMKLASYLQSRTFQRRAENKSYRITSYGLDCVSDDDELL